MKQQYIQQVEGYKIEGFRGLDYMGGLGLIGSSKVKNLGEAMGPAFALAYNDPTLAKDRSGDLSSYITSISIFMYWLPLLLPPVVWFLLGWLCERYANLPADILQRVV